MKSKVLPSFWKGYHHLDSAVKVQARKAFELWEENPFHPSLRFKCVHRKENVWSVRISRGYRALGILEGDTVIWFWIGNHEEYEREFSR